MKQLNFRHVNTTSKKFTVTVNFFQKETKTAPNRPILFCLVYQRVFGHFATIPDYFRTFPETTEDPRRLPRMSEDSRRCLRTTEDFRGEIRKFSKSRYDLTMLKDYVVSFSRKTRQTLNTIFSVNSKHQRIG